MYENVSLMGQLIQNKAFEAFTGINIKLTMGQISASSVLLNASMCLRIHIVSWHNKIMAKNSPKQHLYFTTRDHFIEDLFALLLTISTGNRSQRPFAHLYFKLYSLEP